MDESFCRCPGCGGPAASAADTEDGDPSNMLVRAGYLRALAVKFPEGVDREMLLRAARSLLVAAKLLGGQ